LKGSCQRGKSRANWADTRMRICIQTDYKWEDSIKFRRVSIEEVFFQAQIESYKDISAL